MLRKTAYLFSTLVVVFTLVLIGRLLLDGAAYILTGEWFAGDFWDFRSESYTATMMLAGSLIVSLIALVIAVPIGIGSAIYISEFCKGKKRAFIKIMLELLSGVPSVVYGLLGVVILIPLLQPVILSAGGASGDTVLTAGVLLAIMILPTVITFADDALRCVPRQYREEGRALGLTQTQIITAIILPVARRGLLGAVMLAWGRAVGETIAVFLVVGRSDRPFAAVDSFFDYLIGAGQTLTSKLGGSELSLAYGHDSHWGAMMGLGLALWLAVGTVSFFAEKFIKTSA